MAQKVKRPVRPLKKQTCGFLCVASVRSDICGLVFMCCVRARATGLSVLCQDCRWAVYIHYLSKWTRLLEHFYKHFVCKTPSLFFQQVLQWLLQMCKYSVYIFLPLVKCCIEAVHFFRMGQNIFLCYCNKNSYFCIACDYHSVHTVSVFSQGRQINEACHVTIKQTRFPFL